MRCVEYGIGSDPIIALRPPRLGLLRSASWLVFLCVYVIPCEEPRAQAASQPVLNSYEIGSSLSSSGGAFGTVCSNNICSNLAIDAQGFPVSNLFDPTLPTIVLTQGWAPNADLTTSLASIDGFQLHNLTDAIAAKAGTDSSLKTNLITVTWQQAFTGLNPLGQVNALAATPTVGVALASEIEQLTGTTYAKPIQFIGFSDGTVVNAYAANALAFNSNYHYSLSQFTTLDAPMVLGASPVTVSPSLFQALLPQGSVQYFDNFYAPFDLTSPTTGGFGNAIPGAAAGGGVMIPNCANPPQNVGCIISNSIDHATFVANGSETGHQQVADRFYTNQILGTTGLPIAAWISPVLGNVPTSPAFQWQPPTSQTWSNINVPMGITLSVGSGNTADVGNIDNQGVIQALSGGVVQVSGGAISNGIVFAGDGGVVQLGQNGTLRNATLTSAGSGTFQGLESFCPRTSISCNVSALENVTLDVGTTYTALPGNITVLRNTITNKGTLATTFITSSFEEFVIDGPVTFTGGGQALFNNNFVESALFFTNSSTLHQSPSPDRLTNVDNVISTTAGGFGVISVDTTNQGTIQATGAGARLIVGTGGEPGFIPPTAIVNQGLMQASNGGTLVFGGTLDNTGGTIKAVFGGVVDLSGTSFANRSGTTLQGGSYQVISSGVTTQLILGGGKITTNKAEVILSGVNSIFSEINALADNQGKFGILDGRVFATAGNLSNSGNITIGAAGSAIQVNGSFNQSTGSTLLGGGTLQASGGINVTGGTIGGTGNIVGTVISNGGKVQVGASPDPLHIAGDFTQKGGEIDFEIDPDGHGGFLESTLVFDLGTKISIIDATIKFDLLGGADPVTFFKDGLFDIDTFFRMSNGDPFLNDFDLASIFSNDTFVTDIPGFDITGFDPSSGSLIIGDNASASVPEPATSLLFLGGLGGLWGLAHRRRRLAA